MITLTDFQDVGIFRRLKFITYVGFLCLISAIITGVVVGTSTAFIPEIRDTVGLTTIILSWAGLSLLCSWYLYHASFNGWIGRSVLWLQKLSEARSYSLGGSGKYAGMFDEAFSRVKDDKSIYFGRSMFNPSWKIGAPDDRHMITFGGSRGGKGISCIMPNLLTWKGSVLVIDPKGTNTHVTAERRTRMGSKTYVLDPFNQTSIKGAFFNPLDIIDPDSITCVEDIKLITEGLIPPEGGDSSQYFTESAQVILAGYIVHVKTSGHYENPSLINVKDILSTPLSEQKKILSEMSVNDRCGGLARNAATRILDGMGSNGSEFSGVMNTMNTNLWWLASEGFKTMLSKSSFTFDEMKEHRTAVYLVLPPDMLDTHHLFLRLFINIAISRYGRGGKAKVPGLFVVDEAKSLGFMRELAKAYAVLASSNLFVWTFWQDKNQLEKLYPDEYRTFIGSSRGAQIFSIENEDAEWVSDVIGTRGIVDDVKRTSAVMNYRDSVSITKEVGRDSSQMIVTRSGKSPMLLRATAYHKDSDFAHLAFKDPDHPWPSEAYTKRKNLYKVGYAAFWLAPIAGVSMFMLTLAGLLSYFLHISVFFVFILGTTALILKERFKPDWKIPVFDHAFAFGAFFVRAVIQSTKDEAEGHRRDAEIYEFDGINQ